MKQQIKKSVVMFLVVFLLAGCGNARNKELSQVSESETENKQEVRENNIKENSVQQGNVTDKQLVKISDGNQITFSFKIPGDWLKETRHSGEKKLNVEEMRDFLATSYRGNLKTNSNLYSDYYDMPWSEIEKMSDKEVEKAYFSPMFPDASVSAGNYIQYTDLNFHQINFYIKDQSAENIIADVKQKHEEECDEHGSDSAGCGVNALVWKKEMVNNRDVDVLVYSVDKDENGIEKASKGGTGGKKYYIEIPKSNKTLIISKQAKGSVGFEADFANLIKTLTFE